jgi:hypothetical protein
MITFKQVTFITILFFFSCTSKEEKTKNLEQDLEHNEQTSHAEDSSIELNNGNKWLINAEMKLPLVLLEKDLANFKGEKLAEYLILADAIQKNLNLLVSSCTMDGKAHDELHKWLIPLILVVKDFKESKNLDDAKLKLDEINKSLKLFNTYFIS